MDKLSSGKPTPGGGSASALVGCVGASLLKMVLNITIKKTDDENEKEILEKLISELDSIIGRFLQLVEEDAFAFDSVISAFNMPKNTEEEKERRRVAIQDAFKRAAIVPLETVRLAERSSELALIVSERGEKNAISDVGCAISFINSAFEGARYNIKINLHSIKDEEFVNRINKDIEEITRRLIGNLCSAKEGVLSKIS
ncbi:MAG: cyclodeaminase/cyclohydrolase family protein [bacterium]